MKITPELQQLDQHVFMLDYQYDYNLDRVLKEGAGNAASLIFAIKKQFRGGCSTFNAWTPEGEHVFGRNFDFREAPCVVLWTHPKNGYASVGVTDANFMLFSYKLRYPADSKSPLSLLAAPFVTMDGVNEKGLAIAVLEIKGKTTHQHTGNPKITTPLIIRAVLDTCATVDEAIEVFRKYDMQDSLFVSYHFQIVDRSGASVVIEYINNEMTVLRPGECPHYPERWQCAVNYYIQDGCNNSKGVGYRRQKIMLAILGRKKGVVSEDETMKLLEDVTLTYRHKWLRHMVYTLWSAVYNTEKNSMLLCAGMDYKKKYKFYVDRPGYVERIEL